MSPDIILNEQKKMERYQALKKQSATEKVATDRLKWSQWLFDYRKRLWKEVEDLSPSEADKVRITRISTMNCANPKFILRNWIAQAAITKAEKGDFTEVLAVHELLKDPYGEGPQFDEKHYDGSIPDWAAEICVT